MLSDVMNDLKRALQHRHSLTKDRPVLEGLWKQLQTRLTQGRPEVQQSNICVHILLDIDHTLLYAYNLKEVFSWNGKTKGEFADPDMQQFYKLAESFWQWVSEAVIGFGFGSWPMWLPSAEVDGRKYTMCFPDNDPSDPYPVPELITPVWDSQGTLSHYIMMFALIDFTTTKSMITGKDVYIAVVPAEITLLSYLRYELGQKVDDKCSFAHDAAAAVGARGSDGIVSGHTEVKLYLATAGDNSYLTKLWQLLERLLGCQHGDEVFAGKVSFKRHYKKGQSRRGAKCSKAFDLRSSGDRDDVICCRIAVDDHIWWWSDKEEPGKCRLMQIMGWNGRHAQLDRRDAGYIRNDKHKIDFVTPLVEPSALDTPVAPEGLRRLLPEVLQLVCQAIDLAGPKPPATLLSSSSAAAATAVRTVAAMQQAVQDFPGFAAIGAMLLLLCLRPLLRVPPERAAAAAAKAGSKLPRLALLEVTEAEK